MRRKLAVGRVGQRWFGVADIQGRAGVVVGAGAGVGVGVGAGAVVEAGTIDSRQDGRVSTTWEAYGLTTKVNLKRRYSQRVQKR